MVERDPTEAAVNDALNELAEDGLVESDHGKEEPAHALTDDGTAHAEGLIREKVSAQLLLLQIHWNTHCVDEETTHDAIEELFRFVAKVRDDVGVNVLRAHQENRDSVEQDPLPNFGEPTLRRFDP